MKIRILTNKQEFAEKKQRALHALEITRQFTNMRVALLGAKAYIKELQPALVEGGQLWRQQQRVLKGITNALEGKKP